MKKIISIFTVFLLITGVNSTIVRASKISDTLEQQAIDMVETFVEESYNEYYDLIEFNSSISSATIEDNIAEIVVKTNFIKELKATDVYQLPYIQGMETSVKELEKAKAAESTVARFLLDEQVDMVSDYIGKEQEQNEVFRLTFDIENQDISHATLEVLGMDEFIPAEYLKPDSRNDLYEAG